MSDDVIGEALIRIKPDTSSFSRDLTGNIGDQGQRTGRMVGDDISSGLRDGLRRGSRGAEEEAGHAGERAGGRFSSGIKEQLAEGAGILAGAFAVDKGVDFLKDAVNEASDLNETLSAVTTIFGKDATKAIDSFAADSSKNILLTRNQALEAAQTFGTFGKSAGLSGQDLGKFSTKFVGLASDLASFNNTSPEDAIDALGSALRGENEPIQKYGVLLDDASLRQEALKQGIIKTTKQALTPQQKVLATQALIFAKTKDAQGDAMKTSGGFANQTRLLSKNFNDLKLTIGTALLPIFLKVTQTLNSVLAPAFRQVGPAIDAVKGAFGGGGGSGAGLLGSIVRTGQEIGTRLIPVAVQLYRTFIANVLPALKSLAGTFVTSFLPVLKQFGGIIAAVIPPLLRFAGPVLGLAIRVLGVYLSAQYKVIGALLSFATSTAEVVGKVLGFFGRLGSGVGSAVESVYGFIKALPGKVLGFVASLPGKLYTVGKLIMGKLLDGIKSGLTTVKNFVTSIPSILAKAVLGSTPKTTQAPGPSRGLDPLLGSSKSTGTAKVGGASRRVGTGMSVTVQQTNYGMDAPAASRALAREVVLAAGGLT